MNKKSIFSVECCLSDKEDYGYPIIHIEEMMDICNKNRMKIFCGDFVNKEYILVGFADNIEEAHVIADNFRSAYADSYEHRTGKKSCRSYLEKYAKEFDA